MRLTFEQIESLWDDMISGGFVDVEESETSGIKCLKIIPNEDISSIYYLDENGDSI